MSDRLGVNREPYSVIHVTPVTGAALIDMNQQLNKLEKEIGHMLTAVRDIRNGLAQRDGPKLAGGVRNCRNWAASAVVALCYVETVLGADGHRHKYANSIPMAKFYLSELFRNAAKLGTDDGFEARRKFDVRPQNDAAQVLWDGRIK